ncbi:MAG: hypothetical protein AAF182_02310, partial [Pseudomonadota bacterium]
MRLKNLLFVALSLLVLGGCQTLDTLKHPFAKPVEPSLLERAQTADRLAQTVGYTKRIIATDQFDIVTYGTLKAPGKAVHIYIEGDGLTHFNEVPSMNSTPLVPVGLQLATADNFENVIYLAKPCQYVSINEKCIPKYWTSHRYAPEVINAMYQALNAIKYQYGMKEFHLFGYDGGGAVATILAANRDDVLSLRTIAGNLDHITYAIHNDKPLMSASLNAADFAPGVETIPQVHFTGANDLVMPASVFGSFKESIGSTECLRHEVIENSAHADGWAKRWPALLVMKPFCQ